MAHSEIYYSFDFFIDNIFVIFGATEDYLLIIKRKLVLLFITTDKYDTYYLVYKADESYCYIKLIW